MAKSVFIWIFICSVYIFSSQRAIGAEFQDNKSEIVYEKLYLHTDREIYSPGDNAWFKSYLVSGINHQLIPGFKNIYVQLISENGVVVDSCIMLSLNGVAINDFQLENSLDDGTYLIRAYTKFLLNFGEESLFHKKIKIARADDNPDLTLNKTNTQNIDVSFLPEGGNLVLNAANRVAFKAVDETGRGLDITGKVVDENGAEITTLKTRYKGMGTFTIVPKVGEQYYAKIDGFPDFSYRLPDGQVNGIAIQYIPDGENLKFVLNRNIIIFGTQQLLLTAAHKGEELFSEEIEMNGFQQQVEVYKGFFPLGVSKITILDKRENVLAERLIFVRNENDKTLEITTGAEQFTTREKVNLDITSLLEEDSLESGLSVAVVHQDYFSKNGISQTMKSYLLLDSELKGTLESPTNFFIDEEKITASEKLDLVMMVHGWRRYYWDRLEDFAGEKLPNWNDAGLTINGRVEKLFGSKPVQNAAVEFGPFSNLFLILKDTTNAQGEFSFERVYIKDSAQIMMNAKNSRGSRRVELFYQPHAIFDSIDFYPDRYYRFFDIEVPEKFYRANYYRWLAEREYELEYGSILLDDVDIPGKKSFAYTYITGNWGYPDRSYKISEDEGLSKYINLLDYIEYNIPAVNVQEDSVYYRNSKVPFFIDGLPLDNDQLRYLQLGDILQLDFYNSSANIARFGSEAGVMGVPTNAVFSILTKSGTGNFYNEWERIVHGRTVPTLTGFKQAREFYAPKYPLHKLDELENRKPDFRPTMHWNPNVIMQNGKAMLEFYTSDMLGSYLVITEGISNNGIICTGTTSFEVVGDSNRE